MFLRRFSMRRSFYAKITFLLIFLICLLFYFKYIGANENNVVDKASHYEPHIDIRKFDSHYEQEIRMDLAKQVPKLGNDGKAVTLTGKSKEIGEQQLAKIALNEELSEHLSYNRTTPDARNPLCKNRIYDLSSLPTTSVVIIFYNEPYSVILRTIHSVLNTCDRRILREVILVDDGSTLEDDKGKMDYYIETRLSTDIVKVLRLKNRMGLIRARLAGARLARGDVLVFLDAHCEGVVGWLEPLLQRIKESRTSVLVPIIDVIDAKDFHYSVNGYKHFQVGGFSWGGHFDWIDVTDREKERRRKACDYDEEICPTWSPTMAGGLFAISRDYFWEVGSYDEQMDGWGGENLEMSFRIWQCGGTLETIPCSRVGHIFRDFHPYSFPDDKDTHGLNTVRMAKVWMDDYINLFYLNRPDLKDHPEAGDVTHRRVLREKLKCKSFQWYLENIFPEKYIPTKNVQYYGRVAAVTTNLCLDDLQSTGDNPYNIGVYGCHRPNVSKSQFFSLTNEGLLRSEDACASVQNSASAKNYVVMISCSSNNKLNEKWEMTAERQIRHIETDMCLDHEGLHSQDHALVRKCDTNSGTQQWTIEH
ncbi:hypothetical protein HA402_000494 [Bradysia odoriphaga]|nr:hypothetical protein HA402_000494 [Bradysia odoriphaga]